MRRTCTSFEKPLFLQSTHEFYRPRKINAVVVPHGYRFERGRIVEQDGIATGKYQGENGEKALKTPTKTAKNANKTPKSKEPKTPKSNKKRKIQEHEAEPEDEEADMEPAVIGEDGTEQDEGASSKDCVEAEAV
jgi:hypothetical protein